jgi:hypothetical protein
MARVHFKDLVSDPTHRLKLFRLKLTDYQISKANYLEAQQFCLSALILGSLFFQVVVSSVPKVKVTVDFLVDLSGLCKVTYFEKIASFSLKSLNYS